MVQFSQLDSNQYNMQIYMIDKTRSWMPKNQSNLHTINIHICKRQVYIDITVFSECIKSEKNKHNNYANNAKRFIFSDYKAESTFWSNVRFSTCCKIIHINYISRKSYASQNPLNPKRIFVLQLLPYYTTILSTEIYNNIYFVHIYILYEHRYSKKQQWAVRKSCKSSNHTCLLITI